MGSAPTHREVTVSTPNPGRVRLVVRVLVALAVVAGGTAGTAGAADASTSRWGAIAFSPRTGHTGYSWDHPTAGAAARAAVRECGRSDCQTLVTVANGCAALAQAPNRALGWAYGAALRDARRSAVRATPARGARAIGWVCTTGHA